MDETEEEGVVGDEDPLMEAESLSFSCDVCSNPEAEEEMEEEYILLSQSEETDIFTPPDRSGELGIGSSLRLRNRRERQRAESMRKLVHPKLASLAL